MVATVLEVALRVSGSDRRERPADRFQQGLASADFGLAYNPLTLTKASSTGLKSGE